MENTFSPDDLYRTIRIYGWISVVLNVSFFFWNLWNRRWDTLPLNAMGAFLIWWTFKIVAIQKATSRKQARSSRVQGLCNAIDDLLTNMHDAGDDTAADTHGQRDDVARVEKYLALVRQEAL